MGASFRALGQVPNGIATYGTGVSGDGTVVVGEGWTSGNQKVAFRWTAASGYVLLREGSARAADEDGSTIVGQGRGADTRPHGFAWTAEAGPQELPQYDATDISADGTFLVGANVWRRSTGETGSFGFLTPTPTWTYAMGVSRDGRVAVGAAESRTNRYHHAFRWTSEGGIRDLGVTNGTESIARAANGNGSVVVGEARDRKGFWRAFRWTTAGMRDMGTLGGPMSAAYDASENGSVVVGKSLTNSMSSSERAFRWTASGGMKELQRELTAAGVTTVQGYQLMSANAVSADGTVIVGTALDPNRRSVPFRAVLPP
jgi:probable HAF family extracellular repeat protein